MELIKITDEKAKLILSSSEAEKYIPSDDKNKNVLSLAKLLSSFEGCELGDIFSGCFKIKIKYFFDGGCEITVKKDPLFPRYKIRTFILDKKGFEKARHALDMTDCRKYSSVYLYEKTDTYIWEILSKSSCPLSARLSDFGRECTLKSRRDFLSCLCRRINF